MSVVYPEMDGPDSCALPGPGPWCVPGVLGAGRGDQNRTLMELEWLAC